MSTTWENTQHRCSWKSILVVKAMMIMEKNRLPSSHRECVRREGWLWLGVTSYSNFIISNYKSHFISRCAIYSRYEPCQWWHLIAQTYTHTHAERSHLMEENFSPHHKTSFYVQSFFFMPSVHRGMSIICNNFATTVLFFSSTSNSPKMSTRFSFSLFLFIFSCAVLLFFALCEWEKWCTTAKCTAVWN